MAPARLTRRRFLALAGTAAATVPLAAYGGESNRLEVVRTAAPGAPPAAGAGIRVALIADAHAPHYWPSPDELAAAIRAFDPHFVFIAGDAVDHRGNEPLVAMYERLGARVGRFATLGNWEHQAGCDLGLLKRSYDRAGVRLLVNERLRVEVDGAAIDLVGLDDWRAGSPDYALVADGMLPLASRLLSGAPFDHAAFDHPRAEGARTIVLSHCPITFDAIAALRQRPATVLSGHTHGGQIAPLGVALYRPVGSGQYLHGWYGYPGTAHRMFVTRGLGNSTVPFRIGSRPELVLMTL